MRAMEEEDLGAVMRIEAMSFPSPWTPLAYALELRYNEAADYRVLVSPEGEVVGYTGVWHAQGIAQVLRIAVDEGARRRGLGTMLLDAIGRRAEAAGMAEVSLEVRASNRAAQAFYRSQGFSVAATIPGYYTGPDEEAILMTKALQGPPAGKAGDNKVS